MAIPDQQEDCGEDGVSKSLAQIAADHLRQRILSGRLAAGARIGQEAIARELKMSRMPVRDALRLLESEGLVVLTPGTSARVAEMNLEEFIEIYLIREQLEPLAIKASAPRLSQEQLAEVERHMKAVEDAGLDDPHRWLAEDRALHLACYAAAGMPRLERMVHGFWNSTQHYRRSHIESLSEEDYENVLIDHRLLVDALRRRDEVAAAHILEIHIRRTRLHLVSVYQASGNGEMSVKRADARGKSSNRPSKE